ncbi:NAD-dependent succinate-semialdehyde dehydrogenase [Ruegeria sp.]|uniref:NAD-dependent succinate-semialdehyde dehydrogenase n=1 Tax=Ruegeria sp. TaxID=1879320 RepID=UPI003C79CECA
MTLHLSDPSLLCSKALIGGQWQSASDGKTLSVTNPSTGAEVTTVPSVSAEEVRHAIDAAEAAQKDWAARTGKDRAAILRRWFELLRENREDLGRILTAEQGKPLAEAIGEIDYAASFIEWFGEEAKRVYGDTIPGHQPDKRIIVMKQPVGVTACVTPWNFPAAMITRKAGPALAAGCTMIIKPASQTPLSALALCVLAERAGVPAGVLSCVTGSARVIGAELTSNPTVRKLSFTGSTEVGKELIKQCADTVKRTSMELGGNAPFIVFDDANLDDAVEGAIASKYRNAGQTCVCANRFFVQAGIHDAFVEALTKRVKELRVGDGFGNGVQIGPMIDQPAVEKVEELLADAEARGGQTHVGGKRHTLGLSFFEPTIVTGVTPEFQIFNEEIFGPVAAIVKFRDPEEMYEMANDTPFGLAAYFFGQNLGRVWRTAEALDFGIVGINTGLISTEVAPFGGMKESGNGREGSKYGIEDYLEVKYLCLSV